MRQDKIRETSGRIMVLVPHQDDEILLCAGILKRAAEKGLSPVVVMATNGDYGCSDYSIGRSRLREMLAGLKVLGIGPEAAVFLGYADTGMPAAESFLYGLFAETDGEKVVCSHCSDHTYGLEDKAEFHMTEYGCHGSYTRNTFKADLDAVLKKYRPDVIFTTSDADTHGDHSGLYRFLLEILGEWKERGKKMPVVYSGIVHSTAGDDVWPERSRQPELSQQPELSRQLEPFTCPPGLESDSSLLWEERVSFEVPDGMKQPDFKNNQKAAALAEHVTALKPDAVEFLYAFLKTDEIFWEIQP